MSDLVSTLGRLHPALVHLPIGIFLLLGALELAGLLFRRLPRLADGHRTLILFLALGCAGFTAAAGWWLAEDGGYDATLLTRHRWAGLAVAGLALLLFLLHLARWRATYGAVLALTLATLTAAGHFGGALTHGEDYLLPRPPARPAATGDPATTEVFADVVHPILTQKCASCHGPAKSNGDLRADTWERLARGGKSGPAFKAGDAAGSRLLQRAWLPLDAKEHMPPKGKPQLTDDELTLLDWWIAAGAPREKTVAMLDVSAQVKEIIAARFGRTAPPPPDRAATLARAAEIGGQLGIIITPLTTDGPWLTANARLKGAQFGDAQLAALAPLAPVLHRLDLGETAVTDAGLAALGAMTELRRLHLDRTPVTDAGLAHLSALGRLESLNLHGTAVSDAGLAALRPLRRLRSLYVWQTRVTSGAAQALAAQMTDPRKIARWEDEIATRQRSIRAEHFTANLGETLRPSPPPVEPVPPPKVTDQSPGEKTAKPSPPEIEPPETP